MKYCKLCKKPANKVYLVHETKERSSLTPGYCLNCQDWLFRGFIIVVFSIALVLIGLIDIFKGNYFTLPIGIVIFFFGLTFPDIISLFYKE